MQHTITIKNPGNDKMGASLVALLDALEQFSKINFGDELVVDLQRLTFVYPFLVLPVSSLLSNCENCTIKYRVNEKTESYLQTILFPNGFDALYLPDWNVTLTHYQDKTYLPICLVPSGKENTQIREQLLTVFENILLRQLNLTGQMVTVIKYLISEAMDNIVEHANVTNG